MHAPRSNAPRPDARPRQDTPEDLVARLLAFVRGQFCADLSAKEWAQHQHFVRRNVILWPAKFVHDHGFTLPAARYEAIMRDIFQDIIRKGRTAAVKYWPGYLMHCVQEHWSHHWEDYYNQAKSVRNMALTLAAHCKPVEAEDKTVEALAMAHAVLTKTARQKRQPPRAPAQKQLSLFGS